MSFPGCCALAVSGQAAADPAITLMKSRRRIALPEAGTTPNRTRLQQGFPTGGMGSDPHFAWQQPSGSNVRFGLIGPPGKRWPAKLQDGFAPMAIRPKLISL
jgi:hypothetical protein